MIAPKSSYKKIPESLKRYREVLFWGLSRRQVVLLSVNVFLLVIFARMIVVQQFLFALMVFLVVSYVVLELVELQGKSLVAHIVFRLRYEYSQSKIYCYRGVSGVEGRTNIPWKDYKMLFLISLFSVIFLIIFVFLILHVVF